MVGGYRKRSRNTCGEVRVSLAELGKTSIEPDDLFSGEYDSDNIDTGLYYLDVNKEKSLGASIMMTRHLGEQLRSRWSTGWQTVDAQGDRDAASVIVSLSHEGTKPQAQLKPFLLTSLRDVHQEGSQEKGLPLFTLDFESRATWWFSLFFPLNP